MPPLTQKRIEILLQSGVRADAIDNSRYKRLKLREDGFCVLFRQGGCSVHNIKPETCVAGPFTFDVKGDILEIYLKNESICPLVKYLREDKEAYDLQYRLAVANILDLVKALPPEELKEILKIEEPETVKVSEISLKG
jgi:Fe-S-cluster containining protein